MARPRKRKTVMIRVPKLIQIKIKANAKLMGLSIPDYMERLAKRK